MEDIYLCPNCGEPMRHVEGLIEWECEGCGEEGVLIYDADGKNPEMMLASELDYKDIYYED